LIQDSRRGLTIPTTSSNNNSSKTEARLSPPLPLHKEIKGEEGRTTPLISKTGMVPRTLEVRMNLPLLQISNNIIRNRSKMRLKDLHLFLQPTIIIK